VEPVDETALQLRPVRKPMWGKSFSVKEDLRLSFIEPYAVSS